MSPSPGTSRCDDAIVPTLKSLTCTRRMRSTPARIVSASPRSAQHAFSSMHTPVSSRRARSIASRSVCTNPTSTRSEFVCSIANGNLALARDLEHGLQRVLERVGRLFPRERRERAGREHHALGADGDRGVEGVQQALLLLRPLRRIGEVERTEPDEVGDAQAAGDGVGDEPGSFDPAEPFELRDRHADGVDVVPAQNARSSSSARLNVEIALTHARGCMLIQPVTLSKA